MKLKPRLLFIFLACSALVTTPSVAAEKNSAKQDSARIARLAGLCKLWGAIKYFHPYLAYKEIDWDSALVQTIPKVNAAKSAKDYKAALDYLLAFLNDPNTHVMKTVETNASQPKRPSLPSQPYLRWTADSVAIVVATDQSQFTNFLKLQVFQTVFAEAARARAIVIDLRALSTKNDFGDWWLHALFSRTFPVLLSKDISGIATRHRMHSGYAPQAGGAGFFYSAFAIKDGPKIAGMAGNSPQKRLAFIVNSGTKSFAYLLGGLQAAGIATVVQEGEATQETGIDDFEVKLPDSVIVSFRLTEWVNADGSLGLQPDVIEPLSADTAMASNPAMLAALEAVRGKEIRKPVARTAPAPAARKLEKAYGAMVFPPPEYRLLALFRFWNVTHYFFPYKHLLDRSWDEVLPKFIPKLEAATDSLEYTLAIAELVSQIHDTHGFVTSPILRQYYGMHQPPVEVKLIQGQTVVTFVPDSVRRSSGINAGDIILAVDGEDIASRRERLGRTIAASTPQALSWRIHQIVLGGPSNSTARLKVKNKNDDVVELTAPRTVNFVRHAREMPVFHVLPEGFGDIDLARLTVAQIDTALETIKATRGVIFDMRGYPNGTAWSLAPRLASKRAITARFQRPELHSPDTTWNSISAGYQIVEPSEKWRYTGKVVVLINEEAISQAEHTCLYLEAATDVTFIGTPTNGANGDVTTTVLPGGINVSFSGHDVRHGDGRQLQRLGIQPHIRVEPTIAGVRSGRDEVLEKAIAFLRKQTRK